MARFEHLPIYNKSFELTKACFRALEHMPRGHKASVGDRIVNSSIRQTQLIVYINGVEKKDIALVKLVLEIENMVLLLRVATDLKALSLGEGQQIMERLFDVRKQAQAWRAWAKEEAKKNGTNSPGESRGVKKAGSQMSQGSRALGARNKAGPWEPKPDSRKRGV
jgi:hypothetical protein